MKLSHQGLRKAAVLVSSLDTAAADALLDQLSPEEAQQVREIVVEMDEVDGGEQRRVIDEFFQIGPMIPSESPPGIELDGRLAWMGGPASKFDVVPEEFSFEQERPFRFLEDTEADKLIRALAGERPQTIALVLSHLPPIRAGTILARLSSAAQAEVIHRLVDLEETDPEILREVEEALRSRLSQQVQLQRRRVAGLKAVAGILEATDGRLGTQILDNLAQHDRSLAEKLGPRPIDFEDLMEFDHESLAELFEAAGLELMFPALVAAPPGLIDRVLAGLSPIESQAIRKKLNHPGPLRLRDVEEARRQIARLACRMNHRVNQSAKRAA